MPSLVRRLRHGKPIVIVSGLPRSGTSMTMKMLEAAGFPLVVDNIRAADEDNPKGYFELEQVKDLDKGSDKSWLKDARGKAIKIISLLLLQLPDDNNYQVLFMHRDLDEVLASQAKMLERREESDETADAKMKQIYKDHLIRVRSFSRVRPWVEMLDLQHREAIEDPRRQAQRIQEFLGLPEATVEKMAGVVDRKLYRNRAS